MRARSTPGERAGRALATARRAVDDGRADVWGRRGVVPALERYRARGRDCRRARRLSSGSWWGWSTSNCAGRPAPHTWPDQSTLSVASLLRHGHSPSLRHDVGSGDVCASRSAPPPSPTPARPLQTRPRSIPSLGECLGRWLWMCRAPEKPMFQKRTGIVVARPTLPRRLDRVIGSFERG